MAKKTVKRSRKNRRKTLRRRVRGGNTFPIEVPANAHQSPASSDNLLGYHSGSK